jgi:putative membrane protein
MPKFLINWVLNAIAFLITARILDSLIRAKVFGQVLVGGFRIQNFMAAMIAALTLGLINSTVRPVLKLLTLPLTVLTLGLSSLGINVLCLAFVSWYVPGFEIEGFVPAILGSIILSIVSTLLHWVFK